MSESCRPVCEPEIDPPGRRSRAAYCITYSTLIKTLPGEVPVIGVQPLAEYPTITIPVPPEAFALSGPESALFAPLGRFKSEKTSVVPTVWTCTTAGVLQLEPLLLMAAVTRVMMMFWSGIKNPAQAFWQGTWYEPKPLMNPEKDI